MLPKNKYIVNAIGFHSYKDEPYTFIIMELCEQTLHQQIQISSGLNETQLMNLIQCLAGGFSFLNKYNIVHGDIKPLNILLLNNTYKLGDFGLSVIEEQNNRIKMAIGTYSYCHPSIFKSRYWNQIGLPKSCENDTHPWGIDLYSLGITLYETISCKVPFYSNNPRTMYKIITSKKKNVRGIVIDKKCYYYDTLPPKCSIKNEKVKQYIQSLLIKLLAHEESEMITFQKFFDICKKMPYIK